MAVGGGFGNVMTALMPLLGLAMLLTGRRKRSGGEPTPDPEADQRRAARAETERRMAAYLASRDAGRTGAFAEDIEQETKR